MTPPLRIEIDIHKNAITYVHTVIHKVVFYIISGSKDGWAKVWRFPDLNLVIMHKVKPLSKLKHGMLLSLLPDLLSGTHFVHILSLWLINGVMDSAKNIVACQQGGVSDKPGQGSFESGQVHLLTD